MAEVELLFLGAPLIRRRGQPVDTDRRKAVALLAYLALSSQPHRREELAALFWPDYEPERAYAYLRRALWEVNQMVGPDRVSADRETIRFERQPDVLVDALAFERLLEEARKEPASTERLEQAVALYRGDLLAGFSLRDSPEFDEWQEAQAEGFRRRFGAALEQLAQAHLRQNQAERAVQVAERLVRLDSLNEAAQRLLMEAYASGGQRSAALRQYETSRQVLQKEVGARPEPQTTALYERIRDGLFQPAVPAETPAPEPAAGPAIPGYLPVPVSPFIGRRSELAEITYLLDKPDCHLVTIYGPGGMGKTRLALQAARAQAARFTDGAYFISLAAVLDAAQVVFEVASVLKIRLNESTQQSELLRQLVDYLRGRRVLLVLDNFEHLVASAGQLSEMLEEAPGVKLLVTSRERLNVPEEWAFELSGLSFPPEPASGWTAEYSSIQLFLSQAQRVRARFQPSEEDKAAIAQICRMVAGMPLGIELAAAWVRVLSCQEIAAELSASLDFLESTQRGMPERHRSLRAVFEHSWKLLAPSEQQAFRRLAVFQAGFSKQAATQIARVSLVVLTSLVDKALVYRDPGGRYALHEVLRQYAAEKLAANPLEQDEQREAHQKYYLDLLAASDRELSGAGQKQALDLLAPEVANMRAAWYRLVAQGSLDELEKLTRPLLTYYHLRSLYQEGVETFSPALDRLRREWAGDPQDAQVQPLYTLFMAIVANFKNRLGLPEGRELARRGLETAVALPPGWVKAYSVILMGYGFHTYPPEVVDQWYAESLAALTQMGDMTGVALAHYTYGDYHLGESRMEQSLVGFAAALEVFTRLGNRWGMALCNQSLANASYWVGAYAEAARLAHIALEIYSDLGDPWRIMELNLILGQAYTAQGSYAEAQARLQEALAFARHMGNRIYIAINLDCLGYLKNLQKHPDEAEGIHREALDNYRQINFSFGIGMALANLGDTYLLREDYAEARRYYEEALPILSGYTLWGRSKCLKMLGLVHLREQNLPAAEEKLRQALSLSDQVDRQADALEILELLADLYAQRGEPRQALAILICLRDNPALTAEVRQRSTQLEARLVELLGPDAVSELSQPGCNRSLPEWIAAEQAPAA